MCLILFSLREHPRYPLIVAANRDEFYGRQTAAAQFWPGRPEILGGRDLEAGGTWMAVSKDGKISMITNYRDPTRIDPRAPSRGHLVSDYLLSPEDPGDYARKVQEKGHLYNGFNLLVGNVDGFFYVSNYHPDIEVVEKGTHGVSNHLLNTPWPKVRRGTARLRELTTQPELTPDDLFALMYDDRPAPDEHLPITGVGIESERVLSPMFIKSPGYGSRSTTLIMVDADRKLNFIERVFDTSTFSHQTRSFTLQLP